MSERLDRIEALVLANAEVQIQLSHTVNELSQTQLRMMEELAEHRRSMQEMRADGLEHRRNMQEMRADTLEMQAEVRGLQTENRRILDRLFNADVFRGKLPPETLLDN
jgi:hypothetical protein